MIGRSPTTRRGVTLVEMILAVAVLAVAIPLVFAALAGAGKSATAAAAETASTWIVPACIAELEAARTGKSRYIPSIADQPSFPPPGEIRALSFSRHGELLGKLDPAEYDRGSPTAVPRPVFYLVRITASATALPLAPAVRAVQLTLEYPASAPASRRQKLHYYTHIR